MASSADSRFDAEEVVRAATLSEGGRFEIELKDARGRIHVVSLPLAAAIDLGCLISGTFRNTRPNSSAGFAANARAASNRSI